MSPSTCTLESVALDLVPPVSSFSATAERKTGTLSFNLLLFLGQSATVGRDLTYSCQFSTGQDELVCGVIPSRGKHVGSYSR